MTQLIYAACALTSIACFLLLWRSYSQTRARLLFWSAMCFALLAVVNFIVILDLLVFPEMDFRPLRLWLSLLAVAVLLFGFIWDEDS